MLPLQKGGEPMYVTWDQLIQLGILIVALIALIRSMRNKRNR